MVAVISPTPTPTISVDHAGVISDADLKAGKVQILAPKASCRKPSPEPLCRPRHDAARGLHLWRRPARQPLRPRGHGHRQTVAVGDVGILPPTRVIMEPIEELEIDGVHMVFRILPARKPRPK